MITAKEARDLTNCDESEMFKRLANEIEKEAKINGYHGLNFTTCGEHFSEHELEKIKNLGYKIKWNRPCLWYEVSW